MQCSDEGAENKMRGRKMMMMTGEDEVPPRSFFFRVQGEGGGVLGCRLLVLQ